MLKTTLKAVALIRTSHDWSKMTYEQICKQKYKPMMLRCEHSFDLFKKSIIKWNKNRKISFFKFRHLLQSITIESLNAANLEIVKGHNNIKQLLKRPDDFWILPMDDDDWIAPTILKHLAKCKGDFAYWPYYLLHINKFEKFNLRFGTNNYALKKSFLVSKPQEQAIRWAKDHMSMDDFNCDNGDNLSDTLSIYNKNLSSLTVMAFPRLMNVIDSMDIKKLSKIHTPHDIDWAKPYIKKMNDLYKLL